MSRDEVSVGDAMLGVPTPVQSRKGGTGMSKDASGDGQMSELFKLNQVLYRLPATLSLVSKRTVLRQNFQQTSYTNVVNQTLQCVFNTGEYYIAPRSSFLVITVGFTAPVLNAFNVAAPADQVLNAWLGQGNVTALFEEPTFTSASGTEICREQNKGLQNSHVLRNRLNYPYILGNGNIQGWAAAPMVQTYSGLGNAANATWGHGAAARPIIGSVDLNLGQQTFIVPMSHILGMFDPYMSLLLPAGALAGGNFLLRFKNTIESLQWSGPGTINNDGTAAAIDYQTGFNVSNIYWMLDAFQLNDSVLKRLNQVAAGEDGMSLMFDTWDLSQVTNAQVGAVEIQVQQARSRISRSFCVVRDLDQITNPWANSLASESIFTNTDLSSAAITATTGTTWNRYRIRTLGSANKYTNYQAQLGSLFFPQQPLGTTPEEYWMNQLYVWLKGMTDEHEFNTIGYPEFFGAQGTLYAGGVRLSPALGNTFVVNFGAAQFGMLAERSQLLQLSGLPIANARLLRHKFTFALAPPSGLTRQIDCFTQFTRVAKVFLGGRIVVRE